MSRNRISGENAYKNELVGFDDSYLTDPRDGSSIKIIKHPFGIFSGEVITVSKSLPDEQDGQDGDIWFVTN